MIDQHLPQVILAPEPFTPRAEVLEVPSLGQKVSDLVAAAIRQGKLADDADTIRRLRVHVNGLPLPADTREERLEAMRYVPQPGEIVNLVVVVQGGGGGGGDKVLQTVLTLAVVALSIWTGGAAGPLASAAPWIRAAASAAVAVGGQMAISAAFAPDNDKLAEANDSGALQDGSNSYRPRAPMPLCLGLRRWAFDLAAPPYTQLIGEDVYLNIALAPHYGRCWVGNLKIGETRLEDYPAGEVSVDYFLEPGVDRRSALYPNRVVQENFQDKLEKGGDWEVHTTAPSADRGEVDVGLPNGLRWAKSSGKIVPQEVRGRIEVQLVGSPNWVAAQIGQFRDKNNVLLPTGDFYISGKTKDPIRRTFGFDFAQKGQYNVRVRVWNPDSGEPEDELTDTSFWTALRTIERQLPVVDQTLAVIFLRIKSSDDLNGNLPLITGDCEPIVPIYQDGNWNTEARTSNGAALLRWVLMGAAAARPLVALDFHSSCETTYQLIEANPTWKGALLVTDEKSQQDVMVGLGKMGRFSTFWNGSRLCFVPDWVRETPRQVFSGRNASGYRYRRTFPEPIHAVFVEFLNIAGGTVDDELYVYADGYNAGNTTLIETLKLDFACSPERAFQEGRVYLAKRLLQVEMHEWSAGAEAIATTYGDRVLVRHPATLYGLADGRVVNRFFSGALVSGFRFDDEVEMEAGKTYGIDVRRADGVIRAIPVVTEPGRTNVLKFAAPRAVEVSPSKGDLVIFGETGIISEDLEIVDVEPQDDMTVTFRGIPYIADAIAGAINNPIPPLPSVITEREAAPRPIVTRPDFAEPSGLNAQVSVGPWTGVPISGFVARFRVTTVDLEEGVSTTPWQNLDPVPIGGGIVRTPAISGAAHPPADGQQVTIDLEVRTILRNGDSSLPTLVNAIPVLADIATPASFLALGVTRTSATDGSSFGAIEVSAAPISTGDIQTLEVEVQPAGGGEWVTPTGGLISARRAQGDLLGLSSGPPGFNVRGRWIRSDNWPGPWVVQDDVAIPGGSNVSSDTAFVAGIPAATLTDRLLTVENIAAINASAVADLEEIYGDTVSAAASAIAAGEAANLAVLKAGVATDAASASNISAGIASTKADEAGISATAANASKIAAQLAETNSGNSAAASVISASQAQTFRDQSGEFATASSGFATAANTAAGNASTFASQASTSAGNANTASISAGVSASSAQSVANRLLPDRLAIGTDFTTQFTTAPESASSITSGTVVAVAGVGDVRQHTGSTGVYYTKGVVAIAPGGTYRVKARTRITVDAGAPVVQAHICCLSSSYASVGFVGTVSPVVTVSAGWVETEVVRTYDQLKAINANTAYIRGRVIVNGNASNAYQGSTAQTDRLSLSDITQESNAAASAAIAVTQAASASASASAASISANLAARVGAQNEFWNADLSQGALGFDSGWDGGTGVQPQRGIYQNFVFIKKNGNSQSDGLAGSWHMDGGPEPRSAIAFGIKSWRVYAGERIGFAAEFLDEAIFGGFQQVEGHIAFHFFDLNGNHVQDVGPEVYTTRNGNWHRPQKIETMPGDGYLAIEIYIYGTGGAASNFSLWLRRPMFARLHSGATVVPDWVAPAGGGRSSELSAQLSITASVAADVATRMATARFEVIAAAGSDPAQLLIRADSTGSLASLVASAIRFSNVVGGTIVEVMKLIGGDVFISGRLYVGANKEIEINPFGPWIIWKVGTGRIAIGKLPNDSLIYWFGPAAEPAAMRKNNATEWRDTAGRAYFGGAILAGTFQNNGQGSNTQVPVSATVGPYGTSGGPITIAWSYDYAGVGSRFGNQTGTISGNTSAVVRLYRRIGAAAETLIDTMVVSGTMDAQYDGEPIPGQPSGTVGQTFFQEYMSQSRTYSDTAGGTASRTYRIAVESRSLRNISGQSYNQDGITQRYGVVSSE